MPLTITNFLIFDFFSFVGKTCEYGEWSEYGACENNKQTKTRPIVTGTETECGKKAKKTKTCRSNGARNGGGAGGRRGGGQGRRGGNAEGGTGTGTQQ